MGRTFLSRKDPTGAAYCPSLHFCSIVVPGKKSWISDASQHKKEDKVQVTLERLERQKRQSALHGPAPQRFIPVFYVPVHAVWWLACIMCLVRVLVVQKKKKKGDGGSDDGSSSDEEADPLRKKIKWNMEPHLSIMRKAVEAALTGKSTTKIADEYSIPARTLRRYVANEKRDADRPKLLKTVDLGLSGLAKQQRMKAAAAAAAAAAAGGKSSSGKSTPRKGGSTSSHQGKGSKFTSKHMKTMTKNMKKHAMDKKKKQAQTTAASTSAVKKASLSNARIANCSWAWCSTHASVSSNFVWSTFSPTDGSCSAPTACSRNQTLPRLRVAPRFITK